MNDSLPRAGEIWMNRFDSSYPHEPADIRPALVIAPATQFDHAFASSVVVPFTSRLHAYRYWHAVSSSGENGLPMVSYAQCDQLRSINKKRFIRKLGVIEIDDWQMVREFVREYLNL